MRFDLTNPDQYPDGSLIRKNSGTGNQWAPGTSTAIDFVFAILGTALTSQLETLPAVSAGDYVTITLDSALNLTPGNYAFALTGSGLDLHIDINTGGNTTFTPGEIVRSNGSTWASRNFDLVFSVNAIPEPSSGLLAVVASLALLRRRRVAS